MRFLFAAACLLSLGGCASLQGLFGDNAVAEKIGLGERPARYSENPQMGAPGDRQYKHMTRSRMEEESDLSSQAGSMWVNEGQTAYLFTQNKTRREGDILNVKLDGPAMKQVETKVGVIKKLLKELEDQDHADLQQRLANQGADGGRAPASTGAEAPKAEAKKEEKEDLTDIQTVTTRIVEKLPDGNYRVKGQQPFMIGKREYKVLVMGLIRPEDFNDEGVSSTKLLDPQYDVVSVRKKRDNEQTNTL